MRICHITSAHSSTDVRIFEKECTSLAKEEEYEVFLVAPGESYKKNNVNVIGIGERPEGRIKRFTGFAKKAYKAAVKVNADVYHFHDPELLQFALKFKNMGKKVIYDSHEDTVEDIKRKEYIPKPLRKIITSIFERYLNRVSSKIDAIVTVTPRIVEKYKKHNDKVYLVTNYPIVDSVCSQRDRKEDGKTRLCFAGGVNSQWSHEYILEAISDIDDVEYVFFGAASDSYIKELSQIDGWKRADYRGKVPFDVVNRELWNGDIGMALCQYVLDADRTGTLGNTKLFEMMLHQLPVIATDYSLWREIVEGENCGICVEPSNVPQIREAIKKLIQNKALANEMGKNGRKAVLEKYNWESQEKTLYIVYDNI